MVDMSATVEPEGQCRTRRRRTKETNDVVERVPLATTRRDGLEVCEPQREGDRAGVKTGVAKTLGGFLAKMTEHGV